jgi:hypothetical protein
MMNTLDKKKAGFSACFKLMQRTDLPDKRVAVAGDVFGHALILPESTIISQLEDR